MCAIAKEVVKKNGLESIEVIGKRSTDCTLSELRAPADVIVMEIFDTELIGEGVLGTMRHAVQVRSPFSSTWDSRQALARPDVVCVPAAGTVMVQLFHSEALWSTHAMDGARMGPLSLDPHGGPCAGIGAVHDVRITDDVLLLSPPIAGWTFSFRYRG
jgi:protein arginine N-methyltransferase 7